ncbi:MAG: hypothetical protein E5X11_27260 [Mesorhizobium sp.]|nr:MAG: hypothetical protein E5X11_27260 [Mesorhizobium sp.]
MITAGRIMEAVENFRSRHRPELDVERLRRVDSRETLAELVELAAQDAAPLAVTDPDGSVIGVIDRQILLDGLRKGEERERP